MKLFSIFLVVTVPTTFYKSFLLRLVPGFGLIPCPYSRLRSYELQGFNHITILLAYSSYTPKFHFVCRQISPFYTIFHICPMKIGKVDSVFRESHLLKPSQENQVYSAEEKRALAMCPGGCWQVADMLGHCFPRGNPKTWVPVTAPIVSNSTQEFDFPTMNG